MDTGNDWPAMNWGRRSGWSRFSVVCLLIERGGSPRRLSGSECGSQWMSVCRAVWKQNDVEIFGTILPGSVRTSHLGARQERGPGPPAKEFGSSPGKWAAVLPCAVLLWSDAVVAVCVYLVCSTHEARLLVTKCRFLWADRPIDNA